MRSTIRVAALRIAVIVTGYELKVAGVSISVVDAYSKQSREYLMVSINGE